MNEEAVKQAIDRLQRITKISQNTAYNVDYSEIDIKSIEIVLEYIKELEKDVKDAMDGYNDLGKDLAFNFVSKEDIRDTIRELREYKISNKDELPSNEYAEEILQRLLGE